MSPMVPHRRENIRLRNPAIGKELFLKQESADATGAQSKRLSLEQSLEAVSKPRAAGSPVSRH